MNSNPSGLGGKVKGNSGRAKPFGVVAKEYVDEKSLHKGGKAKDNWFVAKGGKRKVMH